MTNVERLTTREFWDSVYGQGDGDTVLATEARRRGLRAWLDRARLRVGANPGQSYSDFVLCQMLLEQLPRRSDWSAIEIGCAPGRNLVMLQRLFGYEPFGVEYSPAGVEGARRLVARHGLNPNNIIESDFFAPEFQSQHRGSFNVVLSLGFIEHFSNVEEVIGAHVRLLKPGGYLVCSIPNLRGATYPFLSLLGHQVLRLHNLDLMRSGRFRAAFRNQPLRTNVCAYAGGYRLFHIPRWRDGRLARLGARVFDRADDVLDHLMFVLLRGRPVCNRWSSMLLYIGQRLP